MGKSSRKEKEMIRTRRDILEAAAPAFARRGFHGTTMEDIALEAGYSTSSLYTYFKGKEDVYRSLLVAVAEEFDVLKQEPILPSLGFRERFEWLIRRKFELIEKNRDFFVVFASQRAIADPDIGSEMGDLVRTSFLKWIEFMAELLTQGIQEGVVHSTETRDLAYFVTGTLNTAVFRWVAGDLSTSLQDHVTTLLKFLYTGIGAQSSEVE